MTWSDELAAGSAAIAAKDYSSAYACFARAHEIGHEFRRPHLAAHRGMIRAGWGGRRIDRVARNVFLLVAATIFDWKRQPAAA